MNKFLFRALIFIGILVVFKLLQTMLVINNLNSKDSSNFYGVQSEKPRIILVGSSNLDFNYDYKLLNQTFENYDVVGCNLNEPSGLYATIYKLKKLSPKKNDIILFAVPHSLYEPAKLIPLGSKGKKGFSAAMISESLSDFPMKFIEAIINIKTSDTFKLIKESNEMGIGIDSIQFSATTEADELPDFLACKKLDGAFDISSTGLDKDYLNEIQAFLKDEFEAEILFRFPAVKEFEYVIDTKRLDFLSTNYNFLNNFEVSIYSDEYWYNQWYHLNNCGRQLSTEKLIKELNTHLN